MKKQLLAGAAVGVLAAIDPAVAQSPTPPQAFSWTGFYVGGNIGASFGKVKTDLTQAPGTFTVSNGAGSRHATIPGFAQPDDELFPSGFIGGGQIGYNWQLSPIWVLGIEADIQGADEKASANFSNGISFVGLVPGSEGSTTQLPVLGTAVTNYATKIVWFGTVRPRAGYVWGDGTVFSYVTGGLAYGKIDVGGTSTSTFSFDSTTLSVSQAFDHSHVNTGWVVGSGTEGKLLIPGWTYKIEVLYMDLGHLDATGSGGSSTTTVGPNTFTATVGPVTAHSHFTDTIVRAGLNYQFH